MKEVLEDLRKIVGEDFVITEEGLMKDYLKDETADSVLPQPADNVILTKPSNVQEVSDILRFANQTEVPIFLRGAGTGLVGGCIPTEDGIILSMERMNEIKIDKKNLMVVAEAGVTLETLFEAVEDAGMLFPPHPGDEGAQIGGLIACNAGGARAMKHGVMRNYVKGLEVVTPTGETIHLGGKLLKNNAGYDLMHLIIGSEGTLGIITKATLRLYPRFGATATLVVPYDDRHDAMETVPKILQEGIIPMAIEFVEKELIEKSAEHLGEEWPGKEGNVFLIFILSGETKDEVYSESEKIVEITQNYNSLEPLIAERRKDQEKILNIRSNIYTALKPDTADILDVTVPPARLGDLIDVIDEIAEKFDTYIPAYGHAGDGNLHPHIMLEEGKDQGYIRKIKTDIYKATVDMGGTITGEHGTGRIRRKDLSLSLSSEEIQLIKRIKKVFDPQNILNPGIISFPDKKES